MQGEEDHPAVHEQERQSAGADQEDSVTWQDRQDQSIEPDYDGSLPQTGQPVPWLAFAAFGVMSAAAGYIFRKTKEGFK